MEKGITKKKPLKKVIVYPAVGIVFFIVTFIVNQYADIHLLGNRIDLRIVGIIVLATMIGYSIPSLKKIAQS